jgi:chromosome segregation ATPase
MILSHLQKIISVKFQIIKTLSAAMLDGKAADIKNKTNITEMHTAARHSAPVAPQTDANSGKTGKNIHEIKNISREIKKIESRMKKIELRIETIPCEINPVSCEMKTINPRMKKKQPRMKKIELEMKPVSCEMKVISSMFFGVFRMLFSN